MASHVSRCGTRADHGASAPGRLRCTEHNHLLGRLDLASPHTSHVRRASPELIPMAGLRYEQEHHVRGAEREHLSDANKLTSSRNTSSAQIMGFRHLLTAVPVLERT